MEALARDEMIFGLGPAGTGKTYLAVAQAVSQLISGSVDRLILSRPAVEAGERLGFLPGDMKEKVDPYLRPLYDALYDMLPTEQVERLHVGRLHRRARDDGLFARADHHSRRRGDFLLDDPVEMRLGGHSEDCLDRLGVDVVAAVEPVVEADQHVARAGGGVRLTLDLDTIAARRDVDAEPLLDGDQVPVVVAEQRPEQVGLLELYLEPRAVGHCS
jgi:hypothetical protein